MYKKNQKLNTFSQAVENQCSILTTMYFYVMGKIKYKKTWF